MPKPSSTQKTERYAGSPDYPVFPNPRYLSKFALVSADKSGLTHLDTDLYNYCYLPYNPLPYVNKRGVTVTGNGEDVPIAKDDEPEKPRPTYKIDVAPCRRAAAINANCYFQNTNGTLSGLQAYESEFEEQRKCFCEIYPYFDSIFGCNECFRLHGGIEGDHWFPQSYMSAVSSTYCNADPITTGFYPFVSSWSKANEISKVPTTTAPDVLGTQTEMSLYWTYAAATTSVSNPNSGRKSRTISEWITWIPLLATVALTVVKSSLV
ncbi:hypothetical protein TWF481_001477 [Arthrobotrys musiformis]|uniref:Uncharacterized protein n=1 Tax=Arthrobotrys musiformis TaxID=47236 RepID=A0AAV9WSB2_9PEZI